MKQQAQTDKNISNNISCHVLDKWIKIIKLTSVHSYVTSSNWTASMQKEQFDAAVLKRNKIRPLSAYRQNLTYESPCLNEQFRK
jgi:hypothetical protein